MAERVLAGCTATGNCPRVTVLGDGRVLVTGACADGREATVALPAAVFDAAARAWVNGPKGTPWRLVVPNTTPRIRRRWPHWGVVGCALAGCAVATAVQDATGSAVDGDLAGLPVLVACVLGLIWWRGRSGRRG